MNFFSLMTISTTHGIDILATSLSSNIMQCDNASCKCNECFGSPCDCESCKCEICPCEESCNCK